MTFLNPGESNPEIGSNVPKKHRSKKMFIILTVSVVVLLSAGGFAYYSYKTRSLFFNTNNRAELTEGISANLGGSNEVEDLIKEVGKIMLLPDETPILATVTDLAKVKDQDFFSKAALGDKVLIYMEAKKAILYRPSDGMIIEVGRVNDQMTGGQVAGESTDITPSPLPQITVVPQKVKLTPTPTSKPANTPSPTPGLSTEY